MMARREPRSHNPQLEALHEELIDLRVSRAGLREAPTLDQVEIDRVGKRLLELQELIYEEQLRSDAVTIRARGTTMGR